MTRLVTVLALMLSHSQVFAVDAGSLLQEQQQQGVPTAPQQLPELEPEALPPPLEIGPGQTILVREIRFSGDQQQIPIKELDQLVADGLNRELDFQALQQLTNRVTDHFKQQGWLLTRAYLPRQDVTSGTIEIAILVGRLSEQQPFRVEAASGTFQRTQPQRIQSYAEQMIPAGEPLKESELDRTILLLNDLPGITTSARMEPGDKAGETRVIITVDESELTTTSAWIDNYGSLSTGRNQANLSVQLNNPTGGGDQGTLMLIHSSGSDTRQLGYSTPIGFEGTKLSFNYSDMAYEVLTAAGLAAGLKGTSSTKTVTLTLPLIRSRTENINLATSYTDQHLVDDSSSGELKDKGKKVGAVTLSGDKLDRHMGGGMNNWSLALTAGDLDLSGNASDLSSDASGYKTHGSYSKVTYSLSRLQKLPGQFNLYASLNGQLAHKNLDSSENFSLGGSSGIRAYPGSEGSGDSGCRLSMELRYDWPEITEVGRIQLTGFYDAGHIKLSKDPYDVAITNATGRNSYNLQGAGVGVTLTQQNQYMLKGVLATKLGSNPGRDSNNLDNDGTSDQSRFWLQAMFWF